jgi:hypothetical protein
VQKETRNHAAAGVALLVGAALVAFSAGQAWLESRVTIPWGLFTELAPNKALGFDTLLAPGGQYGDVRPLLLGGAAVVGLCALLLFATRVPGVGVVWRLLALAAVAGIGIVAAVAWTVVSDPTSVVADDQSSLGEVIRTAESVATLSGLLEVGPGRGLWLLTIGGAVAGIGALVPAGRGVRPSVRATFESPAAVLAGDSMPPGWYPDQVDARFVRFYDGRQWTDAVQRRR